MKLREALVSEVGRKGSSMKGMSRAGVRVSWGWTGTNSQRRLTPRLYFLCADMDKLLDLFWSHLFARP